MIESERDVISALDEPRDQVLIATGRLKMVLDILDIISAQAAFEGPEGRAALKTLAEQLQGVVRGCVDEQQGDRWNGNPLALAH
jgi:hypothetical protein